MARQSRMFFTATFPLVMSASRIACLGSFDQRHGGADGNPNPHFPKNLDPPSRPLRRSRWDPLNGPQEHQSPPADAKRLSWLEGLNRPLTCTLDAASFGSGWDDAAAFLRYPPKPS